MLLYHLRHAIRRLLHEPAFTIAAVLTLALGVGANVAVFAVVEAVMLRPLPYPSADELTIVRHRDQRTGITKDFIAMGDYVDILARQKSFAAVGAYGSMQSTVRGTGDPYQVRVLGATGGFFDVLRLRPVLGRGLTDEDSRTGAAPVVLIGHRLWQDRFGGDPGVIGRSIQVGQQVRTIVGVAPADFRFYSNAPPDIIMSMAMPTTAPTERKSGWTFIVARLKPGATIDGAAADLATISRQMESEFPQANQGSLYYPVPLRDALIGESKVAFTLLLAAVSVVLLIACANVANLLLARSLARRREMALRMALGAGSGRLALQLLSESLVLSVVAGAAGLLIAHWGARALVLLVPESVSVPGLADVRLNGTVLGFALAITMATTIAFGLMAVAAVRFESARDVLVTGGKSSMTAGARRATSLLVGAEVAFAVVLLLGAGLILRTFAGLLAVDPGFSYDRVMTVDVSLPAERYREGEAQGAFYRRTFAALRALPEVMEVGTAAVVPLTGNNWTVGLQRVDRPLAAGERPPEVGWQVASGGYFGALRIPLKAGRLFADTDRPGGPPVVIVSDALANTYFPNETVVGKRLKIGDRTAEIIGVVGSIRRAGLRDDPRADMYLPFEQGAGTQTTLFIRTSSDPTRPLAAIRNTIREIEPNVTILDTRTLGDIASESVRATRLLLWLLGVFAVMALGLAVVGIYGVMSYVVRQRTREIGMRIALGAQRASIIWLIVRQGMAVSLLGITAGLAIGLGATRYIGSMLYATSAFDPIVLIGVPVVLMVATVVACWLPARRAAMVDPARTLASQA